MLIDQLREELKAVEPELSAIKKFYASTGLDEKFQNLDAQIHDENFWKHPDHIKIITKLLPNPPKSPALLKPIIPVKS